MPEAICPQCGIHYYGWVLRNLPDSQCGQCGVSLELIQDSTNPHSRHLDIEAKGKEEGPDPDDWHNPQ